MYDYMAEDAIIKNLGFMLFWCNYFEMSELVWYKDRVSSLGVVRKWIEPCLQKLQLIITFVRRKCILNLALKSLYA